MFVDHRPMDKKLGPILIVEDLKNIREMLEITLRFRGYDVMTASNGREALQLVAQTRPCLLITDILMPTMDGFTLVHNLRHLPNLRDLPVIFLSATYTKAEDMDFAQKLGAEKFLKKPYNVDDLMMAVDKALNDHYSQPGGLEGAEFSARHRERLQQKLTYKNDLINRMEKLLQNLPTEQRKQFELLLTAERIERDIVAEALGDSKQVLPSNMSA